MPCSGVDFSSLSSGDTAWVLASAALVLFMTPGLAFFYGGMVRSKNVLGMLMQNYVTIGIVSVLWVLLVYSIAFGKDAGVHGLFGNLHQFGLAHMGEQVAGYVSADGKNTYLQTIPPLVFVGFQLMFAVITPALITGSIADRMKFSAFVVFIAVWVIVIYGPIAHWVFSPEGWLFKKGAEDFAGGTVVHANAGAAGLAMCLILGKRIGWPKEQMKPHNVPFVSARRRRCCGSAGSGSTPARRSAPTTSPATRSSTPTPRPPRRCSAGSWWRRSATVTRRRSVPHPVRSPVWSRSRRRPASSARWVRSSSGSSLARSAARARC